MFTHICMSQNKYLHHWHFYTGHATIVLGRWKHVMQIQEVTLCPPCGGFSTGLLSSAIGVSLMMV